MKPKTEYTGSCYIGVVGSELEIGECHDSITNIVRRPGDEGPYFYRATKGYEARQLHLNKWFDRTVHPFMLLLDHDMVYDPDTLERLRGHKLPFISGFYMRRRFAPIAPVWFRPGRQFPMEPWTTEPERGRLHELGASGWGCMLIHRDVVAGTKPLLKGEPEIIEDDMDIWPYDLAEVMRSIQGLRKLASLKADPSITFPALEYHVSVLEEEIKPLRGSRDVVGSDIRYPYYARAAGFKLYGDPDCRPGHMLNYPLSPDDYSQLPEENRQALNQAVRKDVSRQRKTIKAGVDALNGGGR